MSLLFMSPLIIIIIGLIFISIGFLMNDDYGDFFGVVGVFVLLFGVTLMIFNLIFYSQTIFN